MKPMSMLAPLALSAAAATPAAAVIVEGTFAGTVIAGTARGNYGFAYSDTGTALAGQRISGTIRYDTDRLGPPCPSSAGVDGKLFFGCFLSDGGMTMTHTINGLTETFRGERVDTPGLAVNFGCSGLLLHNLIDDTLNAATRAQIGTPSTVYTEHLTALSVLLDRGAIADPGNPALRYAGGVSGGGYTFNTRDLFFDMNTASIQQLTGGDFTMRTTYQFRVESLALASLAAVPEPDAWALMLAGFGTAGAALRRRSRQSSRLSRAGSGTVAKPTALSASPNGMNRLSPVRIAPQV